MDSVEHQDLLKQLTFINLEVQHMGAEFDRLTASIAALDAKVTEIEAYILDNGSNTDGATPAQLIEFADKVDADVARLTAAMTPVVEEPVEETPVEAEVEPKFNP